jgi:hypothetical protein
LVAVFDGVAVYTFQSISSLHPDGKVEKGRME